MKLKPFKWAKTYLPLDKNQLLQILAKQNFIPSTSGRTREGRGLYLNEEKLTDEKMVVEMGKEYLVRQGKKGKF